LSETKPHENPLIPNKKLRELFVAMVEMRVLDEHIASLQRGMKARRRLESTRGEEACRVSMAIDLVPGDLVSDAQVSVAMGLLAGVKVGELMREVAALAVAAFWCGGRRGGDRAPHPGVCHRLSPSRCRDAQRASGRQAPSDLGGFEDAVLSGSGDADVGGGFGHAVC